MHFEFLADRPAAAATVAQWYFDQWGAEVPGETPQTIELTLRKFLNRDRVPLIILAISDGAVVGSAELKFREMAIFPEREHWLGGVFVAPSARSNRIGSALAEKIVEIARGLEIDKLSLQTERDDGGLYARLGWKPVQRVRHHGRTVLVMERELAT